MDKSQKAHKILLKDVAIELMESHHFAKAIPLFLQAIEQDPSDWGSWYMAGQCYRFINDLDNAVTYIKNAVALKSDDAHVFQALGIALQLTDCFNEAIDAFHRAIEIDKDYVLAYNSLALTHKKQADFDLALHNYDAGAKALSWCIVKNMRNDRSSVIFKHRDIDHQIWSRYCLLAAMDLCALSENIEELGFPTAMEAIEEEDTESHGGLYWVDRPNVDGSLTRHFLPNFFNTFREMLHQDSTYAYLIGNKGTVLEQIGHHVEARLHYEEARYFMPLLN